MQVSRVVSFTKKFRIPLIVSLVFASYYPIFFHFENDIATWPDWTSGFDLALWLAFALWLLSVTRQFWLSASLYVFSFAIFQYANIWKIREFGLSLMVEDFGLAYRYVDNVYGSYLALLGIAVSSILVVVILRTRWKVFRAFANRFLRATFCLLLFSLLVGWVALSLRTTIDFREGFHRKNAARSGALFYMYYFNLSYLRDSTNAKISEDALLEAYRTLDPSGRCDSTSIRDAKLEQTPNIYIFNIESLFDLQSAVPENTFSRDPFFGEFRVAQKAQGARLLVGTRGGGSASTQYEVFCGLPSMLVKNVSGIESASYMTKPMECLPRILRRFGYYSTAWFPSRTLYFNETKAFEMEGFDRSFTMRDLQADDLDGPYLADQSLYKQAYTYSKNSLLGVPRLTYFETTASHLPFPRNLLKRPNVVEILNPSFSWMSDIANRHYYTTKEAMDFIKDIQQKEPNSLFVILGDHRPIGFLKDAFQAPNLLRDAQTTFILFLGPWKEDLIAPFRGDYMAAYESTAIILDQLDISLPKQICSVKQPTDSFFRTILGRSPVLVTRQSGELKCHTPNDRSSECTDMRARFSAMRSVAASTFFSD